MGKWFILISLLFGQSLFSQELTLQQHYDQALVAYEAADFENYLNHLRQANELRPNHPTIVYKLAGAYSLNNRKTRAIQTLNQMLLMDATVDFQQDADFDAIKNKRGYDRLVSLQAELGTREVHDEVFIQVKGAASLHPESFVILKDGTILLGSIREKRIVKVQSDGTYVNWLETPFAVMGMKLDKTSNTLWVATAALPEMLDYDPEDRGNSVILQVDLNTGFILQGLNYDQGTIIGDIEPDNKQRLWLSNSMEPLLNRDDTDTTQSLGAFTRLNFDLTQNFYNLQGLALTEDERYLYFSDYVKGIFRIDLETGNIDPLMSANTSLLKGIDGLYAYKNTLIAIHNGTKPNKVVQYFLNEEGTFIDLEQVINRGGESLGEPTLGQLKDGYFYYLANSPWAAYADGELKVDDWGPIEIRRIKLD